MQPTPKAPPVALAARKALVACLRAEPNPSSYEYSGDVPGRGKPLGRASANGPYHVADELEALVVACDQDDLVTLAIAEGVAGPAADRLAPLLQPSARSRLLGRVKNEATRHMARLATLGTLGPALDNADVKWVVVKGPALAKLSYGRTVRGYNDLDLLVPPAQFGAAVSILQSAGFLLAEPDWPRLMRTAEAEVLMAYQGAPVLDLHWHIVNQRGARQRYLVPTGELLARRCPAKLGPVPAWVLEPTDFLLHVALHANVTGAQRLRCLLDIQRTVQSQAPDWEALVRRCQDWRIGLPVAAALSRAKRVFGFALPEDVMPRLVQGAPRRAVVSYLSTWAPGGRLPSGRSFRNGLTRTLRDNLAGTLAAFAHENLQTVGDIVYRRPSQVSHVLDAGMPTTPEQQNLTSFDDYLQMVASADAYGRVCEHNSR